MFLKHQISILEWFSKGSSDTEDWSNDTENSALSSNEKKNINIPQYYSIYSRFDQINASLVSIRNVQNLTDF